MYKCKDVTLFISNTLRFGNFTLMKDSKTKEQEAELQKLAKKPLPPAVKKSIQEKLKGILNPFCK